MLFGVDIDLDRVLLDQVGKLQTFNYGLDGKGSGINPLDYLPR